MVTKRKTTLETEFRITRRTIEHDRSNSVLYLFTTAKKISLLYSCDYIQCVVSSLHRSASVPVIGSRDWSMIYGKHAAPKKTRRRVTAAAGRDVKKRSLTVRLQ